MKTQDEQKLRAPGAVLLDMDGTLVDTEPWWFEAERAYTERFGGTWSEDDALASVGAALIQTTRRLEEITGSGETHQQISDFLIGYLLGKYESRGLPWRPGMQELSSRLHSQGVPMALVTSSHRPLADAVESLFPEGFFGAVISADDVSKLKPHPEPYLAAMTELGVRPEDSVAIEDSSSGLDSALASGANVIGIPCMTGIEPAPGLSRVAGADQLTDRVLARIAAGEVVDLL